MTRRFEAVTDIELTQKMMSMRGSEFSHMMSEWLHRAKESYRDNLEVVERDQISVNILQGRLALVKEILNLITSNNGASN